MKTTKALVSLEQAVPSPVAASIDVTRIAAAAMSRKLVLNLLGLQFDEYIQIVSLLNGD